MTKCVSHLRIHLWAIFPLLVACSDTLPVEPEDAPALSLVDAVQFQQTWPDYNERMALLADRLPGYAGHFFNERAEFVVRIKDGRSTLADARAGVADFLEESMTGPPARRTAARARASGLILETAEFDFRELYDWYGVVLPAIRPLEGFKVLDIDEQKNRLEILVLSADRIPSFRSAIEELPVPQAAVEFVVSPGVIVPLSDDLRDRVRPVIGGLEINGTGDGECTLGFNAKRTTDGTFHLLTAAHCLDPQDDLTPPDSVYQDAGSASGDYIAYESYDNDTYWCGGPSCIDADVAAARYDISTSGWHFGQFALPNYHDTEYTSTRYIVSASDVAQGDTVVTVARTTGTGVGTVLDTCAYAAYSPSNPDLVCAFRADVGGNAAGDSGGTVVEEVSYPDWSASGIISGGDGFGNTFFTGWTKIVNELSGNWCVDIDCAPDPNLGEISGPNWLPPNLLCTWTVSAWGGVPPYSTVWSDAASGTGSDIQAIIDESGYLTATVTDYAGHTDQVSMWITVDDNAPEPPGCTE